MPRRAEPPSLADFGLSEDQIDTIQDLRQGFIGAPEHRVIAHVVERFLESKGIDDDPELKRRYLAAREVRLAAKRAAK